MTIEGSRDACERARRLLEGLYEQIKRGHDLSQGDVEGAIRLAIAPRLAVRFRSHLAALRLRGNKSAQAAGAGPHRRPGRLPAALKRHELVFGTGPAGTGKTWLAVAHAVALFERKEVDRIVLSRPAVEAGERLGWCALPILR